MTESGQHRFETVGVIGLGYVGLPLAVAFAEAGLRVIGIDVDQSKLSELNAGRSYIEDVPAGLISENADAFTWTSDYAELAAADAVVIAVPTPLTPNREPDDPPTAQREIRACVPLFNWLAVPGDRPLPVPRSVGYGAGH